MTSKFLSRNGEIYRVLLENKDTCWLISFENPMERPFCIAASESSSLQRVPAPQDFVSEEQDLSYAAQQRLALIQPLLDQNMEAITDRQVRNSIAKDIATRGHTTPRRVLRLYYRYLATGQVAFSKNREVTVNETYDWAIKTLYFSAKKFSLRATYDMMLVQKYTDSAGKLLENIPSWSSFRNYFYSRNYHKQPRKTISRSGLTNYQRNERPVFGSAAAWRNVPGSYQMDATQADIYLVSRHDSGLSQPEVAVLKREERKLRSSARKHEVSASVESIQSIRQIVRDATLAGSEKTKQDGKVISENRSGERGLLT